MEKTSASFFGSSKHTSKSTKSESFEESTDDKSESHHNKSSGCQGTVCWPVIIFVIIVIIVLICLFCSSGFGHSEKTTWAAALILFLIIWTLVIWFFCQAQNQTAAWFFLLIPVALAIFWWIARFLAQATHCGCAKHTEVC
ncbi:Hypothetical protein POVR1_LOCUS385 [uncultured virus]|nr:Hypothetical protein POVR1_LOCUS385 [uncultured virus]